MRWGITMLTNSSIQEKQRYLGGYWILHSTAMIDDVHKNIGIKPMPAVPLSEKPSHHMKIIPDMKAQPLNSSSSCKVKAQVD